MSTITWNSLLLSKGSIFTLTSLNATSEHAEQSRTTTPPEEHPSPRALSMQRTHDSPVELRGPAFLLVLIASRARRSGAAAAVADHGDTMNATTSENSIAADAPTGIGRMYGPISPRTNAIGRIAAITVNVARIVGLPTSSTASTAMRAEAGARDVHGMRKWRTMFSTTTIASSTRMPMEKISANSVTRFSV